MTFHFQRLNLLCSVEFAFLQVFWFSPPLKTYISVNFPVSTLDQLEFVNLCTTAQHDSLYSVTGH